METQEVTDLKRRADELYRLAQLDSALDLYQQAIAVDPGDAWSHSRIGAILAQTAQTEAAEQALLKAIELDPNLPQAHSNLGNIYYSRGDYEAALSKYKEAIALDPTVPLFHENLHAAYKKLGRLTEAVGALKQAHRLDRSRDRAEVKERMTNVKRRITKGTGCLSLLVISAMLIAFIAMFTM